MKKSRLWLGIILLFMAACSAPVSETQQIVTPEVDTVMGNGMGNGRGNGMGGGMMERHHAQIPEEYASLTNPVLADETSIQRGGEIYVTHCASCHGDGGMGDGPAGTVLDPAPAPIARTSTRMSDAYLFWRVSEGKASFETSMPAWKTVLDEQSRWDVINYARALGTGAVKPQGSMGGAAFDPAAEAAQQAAVLAQAVEQGILTQAEADLFNFVHGVVEQYQVTFAEDLKNINPNEREAAVLAALVEAQTITQGQADHFVDIHDRLGASGLMP
jgi:mono/diheme cytochrome c family protein